MWDLQVNSWLSCLKFVVLGWSLSNSLLVMQVNIVFWTECAFDQVKEDTDLFVIDEVGKMELFSSSFFPAVLRVLESNIPLLASVPVPKSGRDIPGGTWLIWKWCNFLVSQCMAMKEHKPVVLQVLCLCLNTRWCKNGCFVSYLLNFIYFFLMATKVS